MDTREVESVPGTLDPVRRQLGTHLIIELDGVDPELLKNESFVRDSLLQAAVVTGARVLNHKFHDFGPNYGVTGVISLAESHISVHTWPEYKYAAIDIFVCGDCDPFKGSDHIVSVFNPNIHQIKQIKRGALKINVNV
jgi:S-adenosylmethionine decarboxylase